MKVHPKLVNFRQKKYFKVFNKYLRGIESDLGSIGAADFDAEVYTVGGPKSILGRIATMLLDVGYGNPEEALVVTTQVHECPVEILVPIGVGKISIPYEILVDLPGAIPSHVVYRKGLTGFRWQSEPKNKTLIQQLKKVMPKAIKKQKMQQKGTGGAFYWFKVEECYELQRINSSHTEWSICSGYEGSLLTGGYRPRISRYLEAIPNLIKVLASW